MAEAVAVAVAFAAVEVGAGRIVGADDRVDAGEHAHNRRVKTIETMNRLKKLCFIFLLLEGVTVHNQLVPTL